MDSGPARVHVLEIRSYSNLDIIICEYYYHINNDLHIILFSFIILSGNIGLINISCSSIGLLQLYKLYTAHRPNY